MNEITLAKNRMKNKKKPRQNSSNSYINNLIARALLSLIIFFIGIIIINTNKLGKNFINGSVLKDNISFTAVSNLYNEYFGSVIPIKDVSGDSTVFEEKISFDKIEDYDNGYKLTVTDNYLVPIITSGIVVFIGEKENFGNTVIIQGIDEVDYWYGNIQNLSVNLYDYVSAGDLLATTKGNNLYLVFKKNNEYLGYDEVIK